MKQIFENVARDHSKTNKLAGMVLWLAMCFVSVTAPHVQVHS